MAAILNSVLAWGLYLWADKAARFPGRYSTDQIGRVLSVSLSIRRILTLYTTINVLWIILYLADLVSDIRIDFTCFSWHR